MPVKRRRRCLQQLCAAAAAHPDITKRLDELFVKVKQKKTLPDGGCYDGECDGNGQPCGSGSCVWEDDSFYEGQWHDGQMCGKGSRYKTNSTEVGTWRRGLLHGDNCVVIQQSPESDSNKRDCVLCADFRNGIIEGRGTLSCYSPNSYHEYSGRWSNDVWHGYGYSYTKQEDTVIEYNFGLWKENSLSVGTESYFADGVWNRRKIENGCCVSSLSSGKRKQRSSSQHTKSTRIIQPIPTFYAGYNFQSRLEARWAHFFTCMQLDYMYEPVCMFLPSPQNCNYTPDFFVPHLKLAGGREAAVWIEIKGPHPIKEECEKAAALCKQTATDVYIFAGDIGTTAYTRKFSGETRIMAWKHDPINASVQRSESLGFAECHNCKALDIVKEADVLQVSCSCNPAEKQKRTSPYFSPLYKAMKAAKELIF